MFKTGKELFYEKEVQKVSILEYWLDDRYFAKKLCIVEKNKQPFQMIFYSDTSKLFKKNNAIKTNLLKYSINKLTNSVSILSQIFQHIYCSPLDMAKLIMT